MAAPTWSIGDQITAAALNLIRDAIHHLTTGHDHDETNSRKLSTLDPTTGHHHDGTDSRIVATPYFNDKLAADVTLTTGGSWYPVLSRSLGAGTWLLIAHAEAEAAQTTVSLDNGTTTWAHGEVLSAGGHVTVATVVVLAATTTVYLSAVCFVAAKKILANTPNYGQAANNATALICIRLA